MRRAITDLLSRPGTTFRGSRRTRHTQRRPNSTKTNTESSPTTAPSAPAAPAAAAAGAAAAPLKARSVWDVVKAGPVGRFGEWYTNVQFRRPYTTQLASSFIIYLAGDLSAQLIFPSEAKPSDESEKDGEKVSSGGYDPLRTLRHLTVGVVSAIPSFKW
jgi:hypothetical protein